MKSKTVSAAFVIVLGTLSGFLGTDAAAQESPRAGLMGRGAFGPGPGIDVLAVGPLDVAAPVTGSPYWAETITELTQQFADGNRVEQRATGSVARDRTGRVRREQTLVGLGPGNADAPVRIVTIIDPVERVQYRLDEAQKIAWRLRLRPFSGSAPPMPGRGPNMPGVTRQTLPASQLEGLRIEGSRMVLVIPTRAIGNQRNIQIVSEQWYAPDLQAVVLTRRTDPRFGEVTFRLTNIVRGDPSPERFEVPADYSIQEQRPFWPRANQ